MKNFHMEPLEDNEFFTVKRKIEKRSVYTSHEDVDLPAGKKVVNFTRKRIDRDDNSVSIDAYQISYSRNHFHLSYRGIY